MNKLDLGRTKYPYAVLDSLEKCQLPWEKPVLHTSRPLYNYHGRITTAQNFAYYRFIIMNSDCVALNNKRDKVEADDFYGAAYNLANLLFLGVFNQDAYRWIAEVLNTPQSPESIRESDESFHRFVSAFRSIVADRAIEQTYAQFATSMQWLTFAVRVSSALAEGRSLKESLLWESKLYRWAYDRVQDIDILHQLLEEDVRRYLDQE